MTRPPDVQIDRLVLPESERGHGTVFRAALELSLGARLRGDMATSSGNAAADQAAQAIAERVRGGQG